MLKLKLMKLSRSVLVLASSLSILSACTLKLDNPALNVGPPQITITGGDTGTTTGSTTGGTTSTLACSAALATSGSVQSGTAVSINVTASGGTAPYAIGSSSSTTFGSTTTITRAYTNSATTTQSANDTVTVVDSAGATVSCGFTVTVLPQTSSNLSCVLTAQISSPEVGDVEPFTVTVSGGTTPYAFNSLNAGASATVVNALSRVSSTQATEQVTYTQAGAETATASVTDSANHTVACSTVVNVQGSNGGGNNGGGLTCSVQTGLYSNYNIPVTSVTVGQQFWAWAVVSGYTGDASQVSITNVASTVGSGFSLYWTNPSVAPLISFGTVGTFPIVLSVRDGAGNTASCSTNEIVTH